MKTTLVVLFIIQWLSIAVIVLNALSVLDTQGFVTGTISLFIASVLFFVSAHRFLSCSPASKRIQSAHIMSSVTIISFWTTVLVLSNHVNELSLLADRMIMTTFVTIAFWFVLLLISLFDLFQFSMIDSVHDSTIAPYSGDELIIKALHQPIPPPPPTLTRKTKEKKKNASPEWDLGIDFEPVTLDLRLYNDLIKTTY